MNKTTAKQIIQVSESVMHARELMRKIQRQLDAKEDRTDYLELMFVRNALEDLLLDKIKPLLDKAGESS